MSHAETQALRGAVVEEDIHLTLEELCQACSAPQEHVIAWVFEGVLQPLGATPPAWRFAGDSLRRARLALWLTCDMELNPPGVALALDLLDQIAVLQARLHRLGVRAP